MNAPRVCLARAALIPALLLGTASCTSLFHSTKLVEIRPVETRSAEGIAPDDGIYRSATRAIDDRDYALALEYLQAAREKQPRDVRVLNAFGVVYDKLGRFDLSARYYAQAKVIEPGSTIVLANIAYSRALQGLEKGESARNAVADASLPSSSNAAEPAQHAAVDRKMVPPILSNSSIAAQTAPRVADPTLRMPASVEASVREPAAQSEPGLRASPDAPSPQTATRSVATPESAGSMSRIARPGVQVLVAAAASRPAELPIDSKPAPMAPSQPQASFTFHTEVEGLISVPRTSAPIAAVANSSAQATAHPAARVPLLTGHPLVIVNASGRKSATDAMRRRLVHLGWTAPRWAARDGADREHTTLFYARQHSAAARALAHTLRFPIHLASRSCGCGGLELFVGKDFLRSGALAANVESGPDGPGVTGESAIPTPSKEHHHVSAKA